MTDRLVAQAREAACLASQAAGVDIRELEKPPDLREACAVLDRVWRPPPGGSLVAPELMRVFGHSGGYVAGAYADGRMIGTCVGLLATTGLHSHIAGVEGGARGRNVGFALKLHQRAWALARGITVVTWTFDPLIRRNAYFNLVKLAATPTEYLPDFYGAMPDGINAGVETDRLLVRWELGTRRVDDACCGRPHVVDPGPGPVVALDVGPGGEPVAGRWDGDVVLAGIPSDMEAMRGVASERALEWRLALRDTLVGLMAEGRVITGFTRDGRYVIERDREGRS